eukprot:gene7294-11613_t
MCSITTEHWNQCIKEFDNMDGWKPTSGSKDITTYSKKLFDNSDMNAIKAYSTFQFPVDVLQKVLLDVESRTMWNPNVLKSKIIEKGDDWDINYVLNKSPVSMISQRESVLARKFKKFEDGFDLIVKSTTHKDFEISNDIVRSEVLAQNTRVKKNPNNDQHSDVIFIFQINSKKIL